MVYIIVGKINEGKTTFLLSLYKEKGQGDGFLIKKKYIGGDYAGQEIQQLSTGKTLSFSFKKGFIPENWDEIYSLDVYSFSRKGFLFAQAIANDILQGQISPAFIDEIGPLELQGKGFCFIVTALLKTAADIYMTVRESCVQQVIEKFGIENYEIIKLKK